MLGFTVVNIILLVANADVMFLFSATVPYYSVVFGLFEETGALLVPAVTLAVISLAVYLLCWIFSKKHYGWMITALVLFILDTICAVGLFFLLEDFSGILDFVIHIWVLYYLIIGVKSGVQLKNMIELPIEEVSELPLDSEQPEEISEPLLNGEQIEEKQEPVE